MNQISQKEKKSKKIKKKITNTDIDLIESDNTSNEGKLIPKTIKNKKSTKKKMVKNETINYLTEIPNNDNFSSQYEEISKRKNCSE